MRYASFMFDIPPSLSAKIPIPGGWDANPNAIYVIIPDSRSDHKYLSSIRIEGDTRAYQHSDWVITSLNLDYSCRLLWVLGPR